MSEPYDDPSYDYYPSGLVKATAPEGGQSVVMEYDLQGNRTKITDPDAGIIESKYNGFGELTQTKQKVHNSDDYVTTSYNYSANGLLQNVLRNGKETENKVFFYDNRNRISSIAIINRHRQTFTYDDFDRITNVKEEIDGRTYNRSTEYDRFGRVKKEIYPSGYYTVNAYDDYGNLVEARDKSDNLIWKAGRENAQRQLISLQRGNMTSSFEYSQDVLPYKQYTAGVSNMIYAFNDQINMRYRHDMISDQDQELGYDSLNRLVSWDAYSYDSLYSLQEYSVAYHSTTGNIKSKTNAGTDFLYGEHDGKPHALSSFQPASGTVVPAADLNITYTDFKKAATLSEGDKFYEIIYGVDEQRRKSVYQEDSVVRLTRYYMGDYEEEIDSDGNVRKIHYLNGGAVLIQNHGQDSLLFAHTDYLGSLLALSDANGNVLERYAYDPWGKRVNPANWTESDARTSFMLNRGYTGHEHIDQFGIINMNGRVYDPLTAVFLSPDPYIQYPDRWLNFNRYSYALNNPFKYTDPTGEELITALIVTAGAIIGTYLGGTAANGGELNPFQWDWSDPMTYGMMGVGAIIGAVAGYGLAVPGSIVLTVGVEVSTPWLSAGIGVAGITATGSASDWKFQWSTSAGGKGEIPFKEKEPIKTPKPNKPKGDKRFFNGSYYDASQLLSYVSKRDGVERIMYETGNGYYFEDANGYSFADFGKASGLQVDYTHWGTRDDGRPVYYVESTINGTYPFSLSQQRQNLYLSLSLGERYRVTGFYHTHPSNLPLSIPDAFQDLPGVRVRAIGWDGFSRGNYEEENYIIPLPSFDVFPK